jgi:hypothetical protein
MIRGGLDMAGRIVLEAANLDEAIRILEKQPLDAAVPALDFPLRRSRSYIGRTFCFGGKRSRHGA